jgi:uncharacterized damage-inducible protein DinB
MCRRRRLTFGATCLWTYRTSSTYFVAHEGHHQGQIVMLARQLGHRLPGDITAGLWQWNKRVQEARKSGS